MYKKIFKLQKNNQITNKIKFLMPTAKHTGLHYKEWTVRSMLMKSMDRPILLVYFYKDNKLISTHMTICDMKKIYPT